MKNSEIYCRGCNITYRGINGKYFLSQDPVSYSIDEIFEKRLYLLIPYYILVHEADLAKINENADQLSDLKKEYELIMKKLEKAHIENKIDTHQKIIICNLSQRIINHIGGIYHNVREEVNTIMGGQIINYEGRDIFYDGRNSMLEILFRAGEIDEDTMRRFWNDAVPMAENAASTAPCDERLAPCPGRDTR